MRNFYSSILLLTLLIVTSPVFAQKWNYDTLTVPKWGMTATTIGNKVVFFAGHHWVGNTRTDIQHMEFINTETGEKQLIDLPQHQIDPAVAVLGSKLLFAGGLPVTNKVNIYDTINKSWSSVEMIRDKQAIGVAYNDTLAIFGGGYSYSESNEVEDVEIYNVKKNTITTTLFPLELSFPSPRVPKRQMIAGVHINGKMLFAGGNNSFLYHMVNIYDVESQTWLENDSLSQKKTRVTAFVYHNKAYFAGGEKLNTNGRETGADTIDIYDPETGEWDILQIPQNMMPSGDRPFLNAVVSGCKLFLLPRSQNGVNDIVTVYDFVRDQWTQESLPTPRSNATMVACKNKVYFAGGKDIENNSGTKFYETNHIDIYNLAPKILTSINGSTSVPADFDSVSVEEKDTITVKIINDGDYGLVFAKTPFEITGPNTEDFTFVSTGIDTLQPLEETLVQVIFSPTAKGNREAALLIRSNDPENPEKAIGLQGAGLDPLSVKQPGSPAVSIYPNPAHNKIVADLGKFSSEGKWQIFDTYGQPRKEGSYRGSMFEIKSLNLLPGIYFIEIIAGEQRMVNKIVIE